MSPKQLSKLLPIVFYFAILLCTSCNNTSSEEQKVADSTGKEKISDSTISIEHSHADATLTNNEVKAEAPDANIKIEQGYALPRQSSEVAQSPINIVSDKTDKSGKEKVLFAFHSTFDTAENLGHTIQVDFKKGSTCTINGKNYASKQIHFHTPSEHLVDGLTFPMEMHIVNVWNDSANGNKPSYTVITVLFKIGAENKFIKEFLDKIPGEEGKKNPLQTDEVKLDDLLSQFTGNEIKSYYTYKGSLTTPPYTESVQWVILKHVMEASEEQIMAIEKMEGNNARHVQAINGRVVYNQ